MNHASLSFFHKMRVNPEGERITANHHDHAFSKSIRNVGKWLMLSLSVPIGIIMLPISCCVRNPMAGAVFGEEVEEPFAANTSIMVFGSLSTVTGCCCCFGCCGKFAPVEV